MFVFVEDSGSDLASALGSLARMGVQNSKVFDSSLRAVEYLELVEAGAEAAPEAVIVDLLLRQGAGQEVLRFVKSRASLRKIPMVVWTVVEEELQHKVCIALGAREVLVKSRRAQELREAIVRLRSAGADLRD